jgi:hypothetical protein
LRNEMVRRTQKKLFSTGNGTVFRGSVQHLRVIFPGQGERLRVLTNSRQVGKESKIAEASPTDLNKAGKVEGVR